MPAGRDSGTVWLDLLTRDPGERYKMALFHENSLSLHASADGVHWRRIGETGLAGDRTTFFYNPFRKVWVFGIRDNLKINRGRYRRYWEDARFRSREQRGAASIRWPGCGRTRRTLRGPAWRPRPSSTTSTASDTRA